MRTQGCEFKQGERSRSADTSRFSLLIGLELAVISKHSVSHAGILISSEQSGVTQSTELSSVKYIILLVASQYR